MRGAVRVLFHVGAAATVAPVPLANSSQRVAFASDREPHHYSLVTSVSVRGVGVSEVGRVRVQGGVSLGFLCSTRRWNRHRHRRQLSALILGIELGHGTHNWL